MCPKATPAATVLASLLVLGAATPAPAWPFGPAKSPPARPAPPPAAQPEPGKAKASAEERARADKLDPLTRVAFWTRETSLDPNDADAGVALASALRATGRYDEAADAAGRVLTLHPRSAPAMFEVARARVSQGKGFYAIKPLQDLAAMDARDARPLALLGVAYEQNEQPDLARAAYEQALKLSPDNPQALSNYALFRALHGEPQAAEGMLRRAVAQPGAGAVQRQNLALVLGLEGKLGEAERLIRQDLPPEAADQDLAYLRALNAHPTRAAPAALTGSGSVSGGRSWGAVEASEAVQTRTPSR